MLKIKYFKDRNRGSQTLNYGAKWEIYHRCGLGVTMSHLTHHLHHSSFSNPSFAFPTSKALHLRHLAHSPSFSVTSPTLQLILQPFRCLSYVTAHCPTLPFVLLRQSSFSNPSFAFPTSQALHLRHLTSRPWKAYALCPCPLFDMVKGLSRSHIRVQRATYGGLSRHDPEDRVL